MTLKFLVLKAIAVLVAVQLVNAAPLERRATTGEHSTQTLPAGTPQQHGLATNWTVTGYPSTVAVSRLSSSNNGVAVTSAVVSTLQDFARLASTAYCSVGSAGGQLTCNSYCRNFPNTIVVKTFSISATATIGFIARNDGKKAIYVAYRGSTNINNFIHDSHFFHSKYPPVPGANVHTGFLESFQDARSIVYPTVVEQMNNHPGYTLYMVGHSLGGALTVLQALDFYQNAGYTSKNMVIYTYGEPRVGDPTFSTYVDSLKLPFYRTVNRNDIVPHLPPESFGYKHHASEYWIEDSAGTVVNCVIDEDSTCSNSVVPFTSIAAHRLYWNVHMSISAC
ncbi:A serine protease triad forms the catalytic Centre of A triacylglycerol lipase [Jimgerdemannia flammicorona]|uniref:A serine protease triad forms the catalytic Centre of A triacylglycerol lipase n=1 Tax=Jimgerdemannia flammicorona TaxID=994334 RepID=A0A433D4C4_9FUNG|nr:A serine protease triad forms the catalytic Centre of A triacylglycerol lipase [Jimgerdemannia flammicorona]